MKDRDVDKSMGIVTLIVEAWAKIIPTESLIFTSVQLIRNETAQIPQVIFRQNTSFTMRVQEKHPCKVLIDVTRSAYGDSQEDDGIRPIRVYLTIMPNLHSVCLVQDTIRPLRNTAEEHPVCERAPFVR